MTHRHRPTRVLIIGYGAIGTAALPLLLDRLPVPAGRVTVVDRVDRRRALRAFLERGLRFERLTVTKENHGALLRERLGPGDLLIDLASFIDTLALVAWCQGRGVLFLNSSIERWPGEEGLSYRPEDGLLYPRLWRFRRWMIRHGRSDGPTAVIDHGANPGLVSHFVKQGLEQIAEAALGRSAAARRRHAAARDALGARAWGRLAEALGVRVIQISELDTQEAASSRPGGEFQSTWSAATMYEEALTLSELCWGTHETRVPAGASTFEDGPGHMICLPGSGIDTWVASWSPGGRFPGMLIGHDEAYTIGEQLTVKEGDRVRYRPTVYFAYQPCRPTLDSLCECVQTGGILQPRVRVLTDALVSGCDQLGCLLMGHPQRSWWIGSLLSVNEARALAGPEVNATTLQVAAALAAGLQWLLANPTAGPRLPENLPHEEILPAARRYLGPCLSRPVDWGPRRGRGDGRDSWRFQDFRTGDSLCTVTNLPPTRRRPRDPILPVDLEDAMA
ncbi:MAG: saccharopine dehydrogenase NADP-binding domain-containing protein [Gemmatimonadota bacterium]